MGRQATNGVATPVRQPALSAATIAGATGLWPDEVDELLSGDVERGVVERVFGGWRLSETAERVFGQALRAIGEGQVEISKRPRRTSG